MSASLVGSEMCIRDSILPPQVLPSMGELTPTMVHAMHQVAMFTHGATSTHENEVVANVLQPLGFASQ
eukprot:4790095-Alexandrium_andersonii.AAC.1